MDKAVAKSLQSGQINLSGRELDAIPSSVFRPEGTSDGEWWTHCDLKSMDLSHNNIRTIDPQVASLEVRAPLHTLHTHTSLCCSGADPHSDVVCVQMLQSLLLPHNQITEISEALAALPELSRSLSTLHRTAAPDRCV